MKSPSLKLVTALLATMTILGSIGCRSTASGVVRDTKRNAGKVGQGVETVGEKIQDSTR